jgi:hypothetical protein
MTGIQTKLKFLIYKLRYINTREGEREGERENRRIYRYVCRESKLVNVNSQQVNSRIGENEP